MSDPRFNDARFNDARFNDARFNDARFADTPAPPYYAVVFSSLRNQEDAEGYAEAAERMMTLATQQPGYLGAESVRDADGVGITVSYWRSETDILDW